MRFQRKLKKIHEVSACDLKTTVSIEGPNLAVSPPDMLALLASCFGAPVEPAEKSLSPSGCECTWALGGCRGTGDGSVCWTYCCSKVTMHAWRDAVSLAWPGTEQGQQGPRPAMGKAPPAAASLAKVVQQRSPFVHYT